jgi:hypothetical protein
MHTLAICFAVVAAGCLLTHLLLCWYPTTDEPIELHTVWAVRGVVYERTDSRYGVAIWHEEFTAPNRAEAARQFFDFARSHGRWVRRIDRITPRGVVTLRVKKTAA